MHLKIAPSLLSADFANLERDVRACEQGGADLLHFDVMDGHFVPPITIGPVVMHSLRAITKLPIDVHLMVANPEHQIEQFAEAGAAWISVHAEATKHLNRSLTRIRTLGCRSGIVLNPATPLEYAFEAASDADFILLMSVNPGYGGQSFIPSFLTRCERLRTYLDKSGLSDVEIEVDGGIKLDNCKRVVDAGANVLVSGSGLMHGDIASNIKAMKTAID